MAVHIRLARHGARKTPFYRIVVTDQRNPRDGRYIENIGTYDPRAVSFQIDRDRLDYWVSRGARASHTLDRLLRAQPPAAEQAGAKA